MSIQVVRGAVTWTSGMAVDGDGAPTCYAPANSGLPALDYLGNAGKPGRWYGIVCDSSGVPVIQGSEDPAPGYYVSTTALSDRNKGNSDPHRYVDSSVMPYIAVPPSLHKEGVHLGDVAMVVYKNAQCGAIVADIGPEGHYGEGSIALAVALGMNASPKHGGVVDGVSFVVFPNSQRGWPRTVEDVKTQAERLYSAWSFPVV